MQSKLSVLKCGGVLAALTLISASAHAGTAVLQPSQDSTLYQEANGLLANGSGQYLFAGNTAANSLRRTLLRFDIAASLPAGVTVTNATLVLTLSRAFPGDVNSRTTIHRVTTDWAEGPSNPFGEEGAGTDSERGDSTWIHTNYDSEFWGTSGGDFVATASASAVVGSSLVPYVWTGPDLVLDVQSWLDTPALNFGWIAIGDESVFGTAKRFFSLQASSLAVRPRLVVTFADPAGGSGSVPDRLSEGTPLRLGKLPGDGLQLDWGSPCLVTDTDYGVYEGDLSNFPSHVPVACTTGGATSLAVAPTEARAYYLVVPIGSTFEGSHGRATGGAERLIGFALCRAQVVAACP